MIPTVGASGAISGVLGAYLVLHPQVRVLVLAFRWLPLRLPAYIVLGGWIVMQLIFGAAADPGEPGVAWWAHIGGFATGLLLIYPFRRSHVPRIGQRPDSRGSRSQRDLPRTGTRPPRRGPSATGSVPQTTDRNDRGGPRSRRDDAPAESPSRRGGPWSRRD
jgi:hypothetical protein